MTNPTAIHLRTDTISPSFDGARDVTRAWFGFDGYVFGLTSDRTLLDALGRQLAELDGELRPSGDDPVVASAMEAIRDRTSTFRIRDFTSKDDVTDEDDEAFEYPHARNAHAEIADLTPEGHDSGRYGVVDVVSGLVTWTNFVGDDCLSAFEGDWTIELPASGHSQTYSHTI